MKKKKELLVVGILIGLFCVVGVSYAIWQVTHVQTGENSLTVGCFKVEFTDQNPIQIGKAYPIEDSVGRSLTPYEFKLTNTCNDLASYQINLEVLNDSTLNEHSYIKTMLDEESPKLLNRNQVVEKTLENATTAYKLKKSFLSANETKSFTLRLWLDKNTPADETIMNSVFKSKVTVTTSFIEEVKTTSTMMAMEYSHVSNQFLGKNLTYTQNEKYEVSTISFESDGKTYETTEPIIDFTEEKDGSILGYYVKEEGLESYILHIVGNGKIKVNPNGMGYFSLGCEVVEASPGLISTNPISVHIIGIENIDTTEVTNMQHMFAGVNNKELDLTNFNTEKVTNMSSMFYGYSSLTSLDVSNFNTSNVTDMSGMFFGCSNLTTLDVSNFDTNNVTDIGSMFYGCSSLTDLDLSGFNTSNVTDMSGMFFSCSNLTSLNVSNFDTNNVSGMSAMFEGCSNLTTLDVSNFDTNNVTNMSYMFEGCSSLTNLDLSGFDTRKMVGYGSYTGFFRMFSECNNLTTITYSENFIYVKGDAVGFMFSNCPANKPTHESWNGIL